MVPPTSPGELGAEPLGLADTLAPDLSSEEGDKLPEVGDRVNQYEIIRELGRGGMGVVYLARDTKLARRVAIKFLRSRDAQLNERFILEARATARCSHESIVVIYEVSSFAGMPYMVLEYLEGRSLGALLRDATMSPQQAVELMIPVVRALQCAHDQGIVHRDLKPDNVFVTDAGGIKVLDFGIAKLVEHEVAHLVEKPRRRRRDTLGLRDQSSTQTGAVIGTLPYMSPEQWNSEEVDHRADLWSVGIMLHEMVTGQHPLGDHTFDTLLETSFLDEPMPRMSERDVPVPPALARVIDRCLLKDRQARIGSARELLEVLETLRPGQRGGAALQPGENPYPGLLSFQASDADRYFGREVDIRNVLARLRNHPLVGVAGPTGSGKSSFLRAGLLPALAKSAQPWQTIVVRPGRDPLGALAAAALPLMAGEAGEPPAPGDEAEHARQRTLAAKLRDEPGYLGTLLRGRASATGVRIALVIDPLEELYTLTADSATRLTFSACLAGAADDASAPVRVVVAIRSDFIDRVAEDRQFISELTAGLCFLSVPDRAGLEMALVKPAVMVGYHFENSAMVSEIVDAVASTPGSLPLLQFVAAKLWDTRDSERGLLTEASYRELGGIVGALASHADAAVTTIARLSPHALDLVRTILQRLVTPERTRALASIAELRELSDQPGEPNQPDEPNEPNEIDLIIGHLVDSRILIAQSSDGAGGATVEIVHDSLIHSWPRLRRWLDDSHEDQAFLEQLRTVAKRWDATGRPRGLLWHGQAAREAEHWRQRYAGTLRPLERDYLQAALLWTGRAARMRRVMVTVVIALLGLVVLVGAVALWRIRDSERRAQQAARELAVALDRAQYEMQRAERVLDEFALSTRERDLLRSRLVQSVNEAREAKRAADRATEGIAEALARAAAVGRGERESRASTSSGSAELAAVSASEAAQERVSAAAESSSRPVRSAAAERAALAGRSGDGDEGVGADSDEMALVSGAEGPEADGRTTTGDDGAGGDEAGASAATDGGDDSGDDGAEVVASADGDGAEVVASADGDSGDGAIGDAAGADDDDRDGAARAATRERERERERAARIAALVQERDRLARALAELERRTQAGERRMSRAVDEAREEAAQIRRKLEAQLAKERDRRKQLEERVGKLNRTLK